MPDGAPLDEGHRGHKIGSVNDISDFARWDFGLKRRTRAFAESREIKYERRVP
jgi:hypothetical protein